jgi:hypothetical protein
LICAIQQARWNWTAAAIVLIAAAVFCLPAAASAASVELWACHGPHEEALGTGPFESTAGGDGRTATYGDGCTEGGDDTGGLAATFSDPDPAGRSLALWQLDVPSGVALESLRIKRETTGFGGAPVSGSPQIYEASTSSGVVESTALDESSDAPLSGELVAPSLSGPSSVSGRYVSASVSCALGGGERCAADPNGTVGVEVSSIALGVRDESPPSGSVEGVRSPLVPGEALELSLNDVSDAGLGLANAEALIDGHEVAFVRLGSGACPERPASSATIDLPLGDDGCPNNVSNVALQVPVGGVGTHSLQVRVTDAAGTTTTLVERTIEVQGPPQSGSSTITITVGNQGSSSSSSAAAGGVLGSFSSLTPGGTPVACQLPELSMRLTSKPLRYAKVGKHRVPVLLARRHYVYRGRLTCLVNNHRVSAPTGIALRVLYKIGGHTYYASGRGTMTVHSGQLRAILGYFNSRTIIFRYKPGNGEFAQVKIPIEIAHGHPKRRTHSKQKRRLRPKKKRGPGR